MTRPRTPDPQAEALIKILRTIAGDVRAASTPNTTTCRIDGCLLRKHEKCPACQVRTTPRACACGTRIRTQDADRCNTCRKKVPRPKCTRCAKWVRTPGEDLCHACRSLAPKPRCACGRQIRKADQTACQACRHRSTRRHIIPEEPDRCPDRWVRQGLIWHPVYKQSEVA